jgi:peptidylprolyl isomerase
MTTVKNGDFVQVHYKGTTDDGDEFDNSRNREEVFGFEVGTGSVIAGFDAAMIGMEVGETKNVNLTPDVAYGDRNPDAFIELPNETFPDDFSLEVGNAVPLMGPNGPAVGTITELQEAGVKIDMNHRLAGQNLNFEIELVSVGEENTNED